MVLRPVPLLMGVLKLSRRKAGVGVGLGNLRPAPPDPAQKESAKLPMQVCLHHLHSTGLRKWLLLLGRFRKETENQDTGKDFTW